MFGNKAAFVIGGEIINNLNAKGLFLKKKLL